ncbi:MAG: cohesin domain-containing protein, partial [Duganella sp.]
MHPKHFKHLLGMAALLGAFASPVAFAATLTAAQSAPLVAGGTVALDIEVAGIADLTAYQYSFVYDSTVLQFAGYTDGNFLGAGGNGYIDGGDAATPGVISYASGALFGTGPGVTGSVSLARYTFKVIGGGSATVNFSDVLFLDSSVGDIAVQYGPQVLAAVPEPSAYLMFGAGLAMLGALRRRTRVGRDPA